MIVVLVKFEGDISKNGREKYHADCSISRRSGHRHDSAGRTASKLSGREDQGEQRSLVKRNYRLFQIKF